jgi:hypothetical protein
MLKLVFRGNQLRLRAVGIMMLMLNMFSIRRTIMGFTIRTLIMGGYKDCEAQHWA